MQTHVSPRLGMAHESLCCRSEATAHLARFTCVLRPRQKIASKFDGLVHLLRVLRGAVWIYGTSASCGQSFLVSTTYGCKCLFIEAGVDGASVHIERWLPERATQLHNKVNNYGEQKTILNGCAAHSELVLPAVWRKCMRGTFACDRVCACHKKNLDISEWPLQHRQERFRENTVQRNVYTGWVRGCDGRFLQRI